MSEQDRDIASTFLNAYYNHPYDLQPLSNAICPECHITFWGRTEHAAGYRLLAHMNESHEESHDDYDQA